MVSHSSSLSESRSATPIASTLAPFSSAGPLTPTKLVCDSLRYRKRELLPQGYASATSFKAAVAPDVKMTSQSRLAAAVARPKSSPSTRSRMESIAAVVMVEEWERECGLAYRVVEREEVKAVSVDRGAGGEAAWSKYVVSSSVSAPRIHLVSPTHR